MIARVVQRLEAAEGVTRINRMHTDKGEIVVKGLYPWLTAVLPENNHRRYVSETCSKIPFDIKVAPYIIPL